jgi:histidine triad (HIT) family protein
MERDKNCIFCKIVAGEIPSQIIWEDEKHLAFLDIFPLRKAQTIVIPKAHVHSRLFGLSDEVYMGLMLASKRVSELLERTLGAERTMVVGEGLEIDHAHLKLYPRFHEDSGLVRSGPPADADGLTALAKRIKSK